MMGQDFPDFVFNSPEDRPVLRRIFAYEAKVYDLAAYDKILPGTGQVLWDEIEKERAHLKWYAARREQIEGSGYIRPMLRRLFSF